MDKQISGEMAKILNRNKTYDECNYYGVFEKNTIEAINNLYNSQIADLTAKLQVSQREGNPRDHVHIGERAYRVDDVSGLIDAIEFWKTRIRLAENIILYAKGDTSADVCEYREAYIDLPSDKAGG